MAIESDDLFQVDPLVGLINTEKVQTGYLYKLNVPRFAAWVSYDVANTFYATGILSIISFTWILILGQRNGMSYNEALFNFSIVISLASIFMAILLPVLGSLSDVTQQRKTFVLIFTVICLFSTVGFILADSFWVSLFIFAISMIAYQWAQVFYDSMLPGIVPPGKEAKLSSIAITIGYLGGAVIVFYGSILANNYEEPNADPDEGLITFGYSTEMAIAVILGFGLLSFPIFFVKETDYKEVNKLVFLNDLDEWEAIYDAFLENTAETPSRVATLGLVMRKSLSELWDTFKDIQKNNRGMFYYIIAYFIIADLANLMALINIAYLRDGVGLNEDQIFKMIFVSGISLIIFTPILGIIIDKSGAKNGFGFIAVLWAISLFIMVFQNFTVSLAPIFDLEFTVLPKVSIWLAAITYGPALAGVWVAQRQMILELVPNDESIGRYFGLSKFSGKLSSAIGPLIFGVMFKFISDTHQRSKADAYRGSIFVLAIILAFGFYILSKRVPNKSREFKERKQRIVDALKISSPPTVDLITLEKELEMINEKVDLKSPY